MTRSLVFQTRQPAEKRECSFLLVSERKASLFLEAHNSSLKLLKIYLHITLCCSEEEGEGIQDPVLAFFRNYFTVLHFRHFFSLKISFVALDQEPVNELIISIPFSVEKCQCITSNSRIIIETEVVNCICIFLFAK